MGPLTATRPKIAGFLSYTLRRRGHEVDVIVAGSADPDPARYSAIVVAASLHGGRYQRKVTRWARAHAPVLGKMPTALVTVCLAVLERKPEVQKEIASIVDRFCTTVEWRPTITKTVAGALLYTRYG
jgi:menaquinone-dependent protoporphyrinogen oxidase